jgi:predicted transcriptional regulator
MKTAVSIPDDVFADAERLAKKMKKSRSRLYADALKEYAARHRTDDVTESWNQALAERGQSDDEDAAFVAEITRRTLFRGDR